MKYKSCYWLENGLHFDIDTIKTCCQYSSLGGGDTIIIKDYHGGKVDWEKIKQYKEYIKDIHKKGGTFNKCNGCIFLQERDWPQDGFSINMLNLDYWTKCDCHCTYCHTYKDKEAYNSKVTYNFLPIIKDMIDKNIFKPGGHVSFGGGEVTLLEEFEELLNLFLDFGVDFIRIHSACMDYSKAIEKGLKMGNVDLIVSVDSGTKELHKRIKEVDTYEQVWDNLKNYALNQAKPDLVKTKYIVIPGVNDNKEEIIKWLEKSKEIGINFVLQEIESQWFYKTRPNIPQRIYELFDFSKQKAIEMGIGYGLYERAAHMLDERTASLTTDKYGDTVKDSKQRL